MIPEAAGATPYGIFLLADAYLDAASLAAKEPRLYSQGPTRLLSYHAAELFLKTYMRSAGETIDSLRAHGHDLHSMLTRAGELGLGVPPQIIAQADKMKRKNDYVRVRYVVIEEKSDISPASVLRFTTTIRKSVCAALNMDDQGVPKGKHWLGPLPSDYPRQDFDDAGS
ncbi:MAG: HEPN domain-containing protein [Alphaproteobacteria bacterium]|nr:HEPN domain-containing protein [Alphaproteobacteria bacterium]MBU1561553.1 HEPN domain-containing protein [Alphaproteobacteria bacterium]MBU2303042.1 HEPN domain-containing protein [Alphaproteobacteria bacterium]MBU2366490.1 HEPN domain-containing protein [Alphaproteobacteria bacterium]